MGMSSLSVHGCLWVFSVQVGDVKKQLSILSGIAQLCLGSGCTQVAIMLFLDGLLDLCQGVMPNIQ